MSQLLGIFKYVQNWGLIEEVNSTLIAFDMIQSSFISDQEKLNIGYQYLLNFCN